MMGQEFKVTLDIAQLALVGGLIWGLARMSNAVDSLRKVTETLTTGLERIGETLNGLAGRVLVLEDRGRRRDGL